MQTKSESSFKSKKTGKASKNPQQLQKVKFKIRSDHYSYYEKRALQEFAVELDAYTSKLNSFIKSWNKAIKEKQGLDEIAKNIESIILEAIYHFPPDLSTEFAEIKNLFEKTFQEILSSINSTAALSSSKSQSSRENSKSTSMSVNPYKLIKRYQENDLEKDFNKLLKITDNKKHKKSEDEAQKKAFKMFFGKEYEKNKGKKKSGSSKSETKIQIESIEKLFLENKNTFDDPDNLLEIKKNILDYIATHNLSFRRKLSLKVLVSLLEKKIDELLEEQQTEKNPVYLTPDGCHFPEILARMSAAKLENVLTVTRQALKEHGKI